jgi:ubiquinone/menaquinone biosynthesis C-methylase UbiE
MPHKFDHSKRANLDSGERQERLRPADLLIRMGLKPGHCMLDIGAGTGFFTFPAAAIVNNTGRVIATDTSPVMIAELFKKKALAGQVPFEILQSAEYSLPVAPETVDFALIAFVLHEIEDKPRFLAEALKSIKPGGLLGIVEWVKKPMEMGPPLEDRLSIDETVTLLAGAGCAITEQNEIAEAHYFVVCRKSMPL